MNQDLADVVIKVEGKEFYCNQDILSASSKFFRELFQSNIFRISWSILTFPKDDMNGSGSPKKEVCIPDVKTSVFEGMN